MILFWIGWVVSAIPILMMGIAPVGFVIFMQKMIVDNMTRYGYPEKAALPIVIMEVCCGILYAIPRTAVLGAILMTGYLGGAVATHVHADELPKVIMPVLLGVLAWLGLFLRDARVRALIPFRR